MYYNEVYSKVNISWVAWIISIRCNNYFVSSLISTLRATLITCLVSRPLERFRLRLKLVQLQVLEIKHQTWCVQHYWNNLLCRSKSRPQFMNSTKKNNKFPSPPCYLNKLSLSKFKILAYLIHMNFCSSMKKRFVKTFYDHIYEHIFAMDMKYVFLRERKKENSSFLGFREKVTIFH